MASYTRVDFKSLCRLCISFSESSQDLFETDESKIFIEKIFDCLSIKIHQYDPLPKKICKSCQEKLENFNEFKLSCTSAESTLQCYYSLFKSSIDTSGTIFIKSNEEVLTETNVSSYINGLSTKDNAPSTGAPTPCNVDLNQSHLVLSADDVFLNHNELSNADSELIQVDPTLSVNSLEQQSLILNENNEMILPQQLSEMTRSYPVTNGNEDIIVVDINKCNLLDFINPGADIYLVNTNLNGEESRVEGPLRLSGDGSLNVQVGKVLKNNKNVIGVENECKNCPEETTNQLIGADKPGLNYSKEKSKEDNTKNLGLDINISKSKDARFKPASENIYVGKKNASKESSDNRSNISERDESLPSENLTPNIHKDSPSQFDSGCSESSAVNKQSTFSPSTAEDNSSGESHNKKNQSLTDSPEQDRFDPSSLPLVLKQLDLAMKSKINALNNDLRTDSPVKYECEKCQKCFRTVKSFHRHLGSHHIKKVLKAIPNTDGNKCLICEKTFNDRRVLSSHIKIHEDGHGKMFKCQLCNKCYGRKWHLNRHIEKAHNRQIPTTDLACHICSKTFCNKELLQEHVLRHNPTYTCNSCGVVCPNESIFHNHKTTGCALKFTCETCGAEFDSRIYYLQHVNSNCGKDVVSKKFNCNSCIMSFKDQQKLKKHLEGHHRVNVVSGANDVSGVVTLGLNIEQPNAPLFHREIKNIGVSNSTVSTEAPLPQNEISKKLHVTQESEKVDILVPSIPKLYPKDVSASEDSKEVDAPESSTSKLFPEESSVKSQSTLDKELKASDSPKLIEDKSSEPNLNYFFKEMLKKPSGRKNILTLLGQYLRPNPDKMPSPSTIQKIQNILMPPPNDNKTDSQSDFISGNRETALLPNCNQGKGIGPEKVEDKKNVTPEKSQPDLLEVANPTVRTDISSSPFDTECGPIDDFIFNITKNLAEDVLPLSSPIAEPLNEDIPNASSCMPVRIDSSIKTKNDNCLNRSKLKSSDYKNDSLPSDTITERSSIKKLHKDLVSDVSLKIFNTPDETDSMSSTLLNDIQSQTTDLVLSINDNLPDTLLTFHPTIEKSTKTLTEKSLSFTEGASNVFENVLDNLIDSSEDNFDHELDNILKEAARNLVECPVEFPIDNVSECVAENVCHKDKFTVLDSLSIDKSSDKNITSALFAGEELSLGKCEDLTERTRISEVPTCIESALDKVFQCTTLKNEGCSNSVKKDVSMISIRSKPFDKTTPSVPQVTSDYLAFTSSIDTVDNTGFVSINGCENNAFAHSNANILNESILKKPSTNFSSRSNIPSCSSKKISDILNDVRLVDRTTVNLEISPSERTVQILLSPKSLSPSSSHLLPRKDEICENKAGITFDNSNVRGTNKESDIENGQPVRNCETVDKSAVTEKLRCNDNVDSVDESPSEIIKNNNRVDGNVYMNKYQKRNEVRVEFDDIQRSIVETREEEKIITLDGNSPRFDQICSTEGFVVLPRRGKRDKDGKHKAEISGSKDRISPHSKKECKLKENFKAKGINVSKRSKLCGRSDKGEIESRECSIKIENCSSLVAKQNEDGNSSLSDSKQCLSSSLNCSQSENGILKRSDLCDGNPSGDGATNERRPAILQKQPVRTIRILLERFDPHKIAQYSNKDQLSKRAQNLFQSQPYNLRKSKDVQTYICTMEDS